MADNDLAFDTPEEAAFASWLKLVCEVNGIPAETRGELRDRFLAHKQALKSKLAESASEIERLREALKTALLVMEASAEVRHGRGYPVHLGSPIDQARAALATPKQSSVVEPIEAAWRDFEASTAADIQQIVEGA